MNTFNPVKFPREANEFLLENVGKPPIVALRNLTGPLSPKVVRPILQEVYDREELKKAEGVDWVGIEAIKETITNWLREDAKDAYNHKRSRGKIPRCPTMYVKDAKGVYHFAAPGSDSNFPRSFIDAAGRRVPYEISLDAPEANPWVEGEIIPMNPQQLTVDEALARIECPICHHTESWNAESRMSYNAARGRMKKHLKNPQNKEVQLHMELYTMEFHS